MFDFTQKHQHVNREVLPGRPPHRGRPVWPGSRAAGTPPWRWRRWVPPRRRRRRRRRTLPRWTQWRRRRKRTRWSRIPRLILQLSHGKLNGTTERYVADTHGQQPLVSKKRNNKPNPTQSNITVFLPFSTRYFSLLLYHKCICKQCHMLYKYNALAMAGFSFRYSVIIHNRTR